MKSYLKFLSRNKVYTFINIAGLAVSLMFVILIGDYTWRQFTVDSQHPDAERIYILGNEESFFMWPQAAQGIEGFCPEVEQTCCVFSQGGRIKSDHHEVREDEKPIILMADSTFFDFFNFPLVEGDKRTALDAPDKCVITEQLAQQLFPNRSAIGQTLQIVGNRGVMIGNQKDPYDSTLVYTVSAVMREMDHTVLPNTTQLIASMQRYPQVLGYELTSDVMAYSGTGCCKAFFKLRPNTTLDAKMPQIKDYMKANFKWWFTDDADKRQPTFTPLRELMFAPQNNGYGMEKGDKGRLHILLSAVLAILFFAVSNYINLTVANTGFRAKEMATRRLFGSTGMQISLKLITESTLMVFVSFLIGLTLAFCFEQDAASLFKGKVELARDMNFGSVSLCLVFILIVGIVSGILPTYHLSRYQPIDIVKGSFRFRSKMVLSRVFIILQNTITVVMLTAALVIYLQSRHLIAAPLGFNVKDLYYINSYDMDVQAVRNHLEAMPFVETVGQYNGTSFTNYSSNTTTINRDGNRVSIYWTELDSTALSLYGLTILKNNSTGGDACYLTEEAMRQLEYSDTTRFIDFGNGNKHPIDGVIKDFHRINVLNDAQPFAIYLLSNMKDPCYLVKTNGYPQAKQAFEQMMIELGCDPYDLDWRVNSLEENVAEGFDEQQNTLRIVSLFAIVAIIISVMGFVGMSLFFIRQRRNEIAVRKIMGSSSAEVLWLMLRTFCMPLLASFVIAIPVSYYVMAHWLEDFSYRIALSPWIFAATCLFSLLTAILSVGFQIGRAARMNPAESLRTE